MRATLLIENKCRSFQLLSTAYFSCWHWSVFVDSDTTLLLFLRTFGVPGPPEGWVVSTTIKVLDVIQTFWNTIATRMRLNIGRNCTQNTQCKPKIIQPAILESLLNTLTCNRKIWIKPNVNNKSFLDSSFLSYWVCLKSSMAKISMFRSSLEQTIILMKDWYVFYMLQVVKISFKI